MNEELKKQSTESKKARTIEDLLIGKSSTELTRICSAKKVSVIQVESIAGDGTPEDPSRPVFSLWTEDGRFLTSWLPTSLDDHL